MNDFHEMVWLHGLKYSFYVDNSSNDDFSVETVIRQNKDGSFTILECSIVEKEEKENEQS